MNIKYDSGHVNDLRKLFIRGQLTKDYFRAMLDRGVLTLQEFIDITNESKDKEVS